MAWAGVTTIIFRLYRVREPEEGGGDRRTRQRRRGKKSGLLTRHIGHFFALGAQTLHMAVCPQGEKRTPAGDSHK